MALTNLSQVTSSGIHTLSNYTTHNINSTGIITATSFSGNLSSASGISTFAEIRVTGNLTVEGTTTTLDSTLTEVDRLEIGANTAAVGLAVTQSGTGHVATFEGGNFGIGTDNPSRILHVSSSNDQYIRVTSTNSANAGIEFGDSADKGRANIVYANSDDSMFFTVNGSEKVRITSSGNIAIGTVTASDRLHAEGSASVARFVGNRTDALGPRLSLAKSRGAVPGSSIIVQDGDEIGQIMFKGADGNDVDSTGAAIIGLVDGSPGSNDMPGALTFLTTSDGNNSPTERLRIKSNGYVGIGTNNPSAKLDIRGQSNTNFEALTLRNTHSNGASQGQVDLNFDVVSTTGEIARSRIRGQESTSDAPYSELTFWTSDTTSTEPIKRVTINKTGNVGINSTTPGHKLEVAYTNDEDGFVINHANRGGKWKFATSGTNAELFDVQRYDGGNSTFRRYLLFGPNQFSVYTGSTTSSTERLRIRSDGQIDAKYGVINLGTADSSSGHINAYENMSFNIDSDNDDSNRHFTWYKNGESGGGTGMMRLDENSRLCIGGDLATSANNLTLKHATGVEIDMHATSGSGNNFRLKSDSGGIFTIRDHSAGADRLTIRDDGKIGIGQADPQGDLHIGNISGNKDLIMHSANNGTARIRFREGGSLSSGFNEYSFGMVGSGNKMTVNGQGAGEIMTIMGDTGNIGIGDNAPSQKLNVAGNIMLEGAEGFMYLSNVGTGNAGIYVRGNSSSNFLRSHSTGMFTWEVTGSEKLRLTSDGKLMTQSAGYIYTASSAGSLSLYGGNTNLGGGIALSGGNTNGDIKFYAQMSTSSPAQRMVIGATGQVEVSNSVSGNDAAVNIYKASGDNSDKAILRVGYDASAAFEIYRIRNNGTIFMGPNQSGAALSIQNRPSGGNITERLVLQPTGNIYYYGTSGSNQIISQRTNSAGSDGDYFFHLRAQNSSSQDCGAFGIHRDGANDGGRFSVFTRNAGGSNTERIRVDQAGTLRVAGAIASMAGDNSLTDFSAGRVMANRFRRGTSNGTRFGTVSGYIGDMLSSDGVQMSNVFYMGQLNSSSSSTATQNMFSFYTSGHWGQYTAMRVWMHTDYYNHGYQVWDVNSGGVTSIASRGAGGNLTMASAVLVGSGTHSGQNVYRYNVTVHNPGTYFQVRWYLGLYFGAAAGVYSNAYSESSMDTYLSTRGSAIHFKGLSAAALASSPMYRTQ